MSRIHFLGCFLLVFLVVGMGAGNPAQGAAFEEWQGQRETLRGLDEMWVKVRIGTSLEGPTRRLLQSHVEHALQSVPIRLLSEQEASLFKPGLIIEVAMLKTGPTSSVHFVTVRLHQPVLLKRNPRQTAYAVTWKASNIGDGDLESIQDKIRNLVNRFIADFRAVND